MTFSAEDLRQQYNKNFNQGGERWTVTDSKKAHSIIRLLLNEIPEIMSGGGARHSLDVGCALGYFTEALRQSGFISHGLDYSEVATERARTLFPNCRFIHGDGFEPKLEDQYDLILIRGFSGANTHDLHFVADFCNRYGKALMESGVLVLAFTSNFSGREKQKETVNWTHKEIGDLISKVEIPHRKTIFIPREGLFRRVARLILTRFWIKINKPYFYIIFQNKPTAPTLREGF